jgi:hypothetical protein
MSARHLADIARVGLDVLVAVVDATTGLVTAQLGNVVTQKATSDDDEWYFPPGYVALPKKPAAGTAASQVCIITRSDHNAIVGCRDARDAAIVNGLNPALDYGETLVFSPAGKGYSVFRKDGSVQTFSGDGTASATVKSGEVDVFAASVLIGDSSAASVIPSNWATAPSNGLIEVLGKLATALTSAAVTNTLAADLATLPTAATTKGKMT